MRLKVGSAFVVSPLACISGVTKPEVECTENAMPGTPTALLVVTRSAPCAGHNRRTCESGNENSCLLPLPSDFAINPLTPVAERSRYTTLFPSGDAAISTILLGRNWIFVGRVLVAVPAVVANP